MIRFKNCAIILNFTCLNTLSSPYSNNSFHPPNDSKSFLICINRVHPKKQHLHLLNTTNVPLCDHHAAQVHAVEPLAKDVVHVTIVHVPAFVLVFSVLLSLSFSHSIGKRTHSFSFVCSWHPFSPDLVDTAVQIFFSLVFLDTSVQTLSFLSLALSLLPQ